MSIEREVGRRPGAPSSLPSHRSFSRLSIITAEDGEDDGRRPGAFYPPGVVLSEPLGLSSATEHRLAVPHSCSGTGSGLLSSRGSAVSPRLISRGDGTRVEPALGVDEPSNCAVAVVSALLGTILETLLLIFTYSFH